MGFQKVNKDEIQDSEMIKNIKAKACVKVLHDDSNGSFLSWGSTTNGAEDLKEYVQAAIELNYMV